MSNSKGFYDKAIIAFNNGELDKALNLCEKSISLSLKNQAALNLKGVIYYLKGDLGSARAVWKTNNDFNDNTTAKEYLKNIKLDEAFLKKYRNAVKLINELKINDAVTILEECTKSSFNNINVLNALGLCMMKKGEYDKSKIYFDKSLEIDKKNKDTLEYIKRLEEFLPKKLDLKKTLTKVLGTVAVLAIIAVGVGLVTGKFHIPSIGGSLIAKNSSGDQNLNSNNEVSEVEVQQEQTKENLNEKENLAENQEITSENSNDINKKVAEEQPKVSFNGAAISQALSVQNIDYDNLYNLVEANKNLAQGINEKNLLNSALTVLKDSGCEFFYNRAQRILDEKKDYSLTLDSLNKALNYSEGTYLRQHIIYFTGFCYDRLSDLENATKFYDTYLKEFPSGDYELTVLYRQCVIFKDIDQPRAKNYATAIYNKYQKAREYNSVVKEILSK